MISVANINGSISLLREAKISIHDRGFLYGDSVYEVTRTYQGVPFYLEEHFDRLENSARLARMKISQSREFLISEIRRTVHASGATKAEDVFVRFTITRGEGPVDIDPDASPGTSYVIVVKDLPKWKPHHYSEGMILAVPHTLRNSPLSLDPNIKSGNYLNNILAVADAKAMGANDAFMLSADGKFTEAANSNVCLVMKGEIVSALHEENTHTGNLRGLTKTIVGKIAPRGGFTYREIPLTLETVSQAKECFVTSATREVMPVVKLILPGGKALEFPPGGGEVTKKLRTLYAEFVEDYINARKDTAWF